jgi:hypothetical protein
MRGRPRPNLASVQDGDLPILGWDDDLLIKLSYSAAWHR